jgi:hypothetical protein
VPSLNTALMIFSHKKWTYAVLTGSLLLVGLIVLINCVVDTYGILRRDYSLQSREPNSRFVKIRYLLEQKDRYDSFLFGSSRALQIDTKKIANGRYYNMAYSEGLPKEHLENIRFLLRNGVQIKNVIIALDDFSYRVDPAAHANDLLRQQHYLVSGKPKLEFYGDYYLKLKMFFPQLRDYLKTNYTKKGREEAQKKLFDYYDSGRVICLTCSEEIESDIKKHVNDKKFLVPYHYDGDYLAHAMEDIQQLVDLARDQDIKLTFMINPIHHTTYLDTDMRMFIDFKIRLARITDYYDFSGLNSITTNNYYYHETSHFRQMVGDMMTGFIFDYPNVKRPQDFGVHINKDNIEMHVKHLQSQLAEYKQAVSPPPVVIKNED